MKLTVIQPAYFPAIDQIGKVLAADVVVWADTFQYHKHGNINRARIKTIAGPRWLTIPVHAKRTPINTIRIDNHDDWISRHLRSIELNYKNAAYYYYLIDELKTLFSDPPEQLDGFLFSCMQWVLRRLQNQAQWVKASELPVVHDRDQRVISWCRELGCDEYVISEKEHTLMDTNVLGVQNINVLEYSIRILYYFQQYPEFSFPLSILDMLFNEGDGSKSMLQPQIELKVV